MAKARTVLKPMENNAHFQLPASLAMVTTVTKHGA